jgi:hypothetical protein
VSAQVGINTDDPRAALDISISNEGLLIPRVALTSTEVVAPVLTGTTSELVYNTDTTGDVTPGFYYLSTNDGPWIRLASAAPTAETDPKVQSTFTNRIPKWNGSTLVDGIVNDDGTRVGIGTAEAIPLGALEIKSTNDGLVIPRVALAGFNVVSPLTAPVNSELVYNTIDNSTVLSGAALTAAGRVTPGFYFWNSVAPAKWERFVTGPLPASTGWLTTGNAGLSAATNFLGTTDNVDVAFRRNNTNAGRITTTSTSFGVGALNATNGPATNATAFGVNALAANTGSNNTAFGTNALAANSSPSNNTAFGFNALATNTLAADSGAVNTAVGSGALATLNGGNNNTAVGYNALTALPGTARFNTAVGSNSLSGVNSSSAINNVAVGNNTMTGSGVITQSVAIGSDAMSNASTGSTRNTAVGYGAGTGVGGGTDNVFIGSSAQGVGGGSNQIAIGSGATTAASNTVRIGNTSISFIGGQVGFTNSSDRRWKDNIQGSGLGLEFLKTLRPVSYFRKNDSNKKTEYGFIAQELEEAFMKAGDANNAVISKDDAGMYGVRYSDFISISVKAIQEQQEQIEELKKANAELREINASILKRLDALENK